MWALRAINALHVMDGIIKDIGNDVPSHMAAISH